MSRVAVVGSGIAGLAAAYRLFGRADVTLFEAGDHFGGHAHTVDLTLGGVTHGVDTGFLVLNQRTYPQLLALFAELGVETAASEMSFSVQVPGGVEWSGRSLASVFAERRNLLRPGFWRMLADILRFNRIATALADAGAASNADTVDAFLARHRFSAAFRDWYLLPMIGSIWSCPVDQMLRFPVATLLRFCHNHGLLQVADRPPWRTVPGGSRRYVEKVLRKVPDARLATPVRRVVRRDNGVDLATDAGNERFDAVVLACHAGQALALLAEPTPAERRVLGAIRTQRNRAVLHTDASLLPKRRIAWAAWNYERAAGATGGGTVCLHYWLNRLQPLPFETPVIVSLNPVREPAAALVHGEFDYAHPVFDRAAIDAQAQLPALQGAGRTWFCGAWTRYGFHEDGLVSGLAVADAISSRLAGSPSAAIASEAA